MSNAPQPWIQFTNSQQRNGPRRGIDSSQKRKYKWFLNVFFRCPITFIIRKMQNKISPTKTAEMKNIWHPAAGEGGGNRLRRVKTDSTALEASLAIAVKMTLCDFILQEYLHLWERTEAWDSLRCRLWQQRTETSWCSLMRDANHTQPSTAENYCCYNLLNEKRKVQNSKCCESTLPILSWRPAGQSTCRVYSQ